MTQQTTAEDQVIETMHRLGTCDLEDLTRRCSTLTWNQVFIAIDRLSREGALKLTPKGGGLYTVHLSNDALQAARHETIT